MNKMEYLERLESCLKWKVSKAELDDIMRDYAEYFEEGRRQSKPDSEIAAKLGDPEIVAQQIIEESKESKQTNFQEPHLKEPKKPRKNWLKKYFQKIGKAISRFFYWLGEAFFLLFIFPLAFVLGGIILGGAGFVILIGVSLGILSIGILIGSVLLMIGTGICFVMLSPQMGLTALFGTITALGIGGCLSCLTIKFIRKGWSILCQICSNFSSFFINLFHARYQSHPIPQKDAPIPHENISNNLVEEDFPSADQEDVPSYHTATDPLYSNLQDIMNQSSKPTLTQPQEETEEKEIPAKELSPATDNPSTKEPEMDAGTEDISSCKSEGEDTTLPQTDSIPPQPEEPTPELTLENDTVCVLSLSQEREEKND